MASTRKIHSNREFGRTFPASQYDDPRGGRASALERNILRYRATEAMLYLFYAEEIKQFMLNSVYNELVFNAPTERPQGKKLIAAFNYAVEIGIFKESESAQLQALLDYRNDIAHRVHLVMLDVTRSCSASDYLSFYPPKYKGEALDLLRLYRRSLWERARDKLVFTISMNKMLFEFSERAYEEDLRRLDRTIQVQVERERIRLELISKELDLTGTELVNDLAPRHFLNQHFGRRCGEDYVPLTGHLTKRGVEICYRLFDMDKSPIAIAYLMGISLKAAKNRLRKWKLAGGLKRNRLEI